MSWVWRHKRRPLCNEAGIERRRERLRRAMEVWEVSMYPAAGRMGSRRRPARRGQDGDYLMDSSGSWDLICGVEGLGLDWDAATRRAYEVMGASWERDGSRLMYRRMRRPDAIARRRLRERSGSSSSSCSAQREASNRVGWRQIWRRAEMSYAILWAVVTPLRTERARLWVFAELITRDGRGVASSSRTK